MANSDDEHALAGVSENKDPPAPQKQEPQEVHPVIFGDTYDLDFRPLPVNSDFEVENPKDSSAPEPVESSDSGIPVQTPPAPATSSKAAPAAIASPNAGKGNTQGKA